MPSQSCAFSGKQRRCGAAGDPPGEQTESRAAKQQEAGVSSA
jgi:hypothetical protein